MSDNKTLLDDKGRVNITDLIAEEIEEFILENTNVILERAKKRLKEISKEAKKIRGT